MDWTIDELTGPIMTRDEVESVRWGLGSAVDEVSNRAGRVIYPCPGGHASFGGEGEGQIVTSSYFDDRIGQAGIG